MFHGLAPIVLRLRASFRASAASVLVGDAYAVAGVDKLDAVVPRLHTEQRRVIYNGGLSVPAWKVAENRRAPWNGLGFLHEPFDCVRTFESRINRTGNVFDKLSGHRDGEWCVNGRSPKVTAVDHLVGM